jgi:hypothetical protein
MDNISVCRNCLFFRPTGRYSGNCQRLDTAVERDWPICPLSLPAFNPVSLQPLLTSVVDRDTLLSTLNTKFLGEIPTIFDRK